MSKPFCNLRALEYYDWLDSIILAPYGVWRTSFFFPITWLIKQELGSFFILLYSLIPNFWKFQKLKNLYFHFFLMFKIKYLHVEGFWIPKNWWLKVGFFKGFSVLKTTIYGWNKIFDDVRQCFRYTTHTQLSFLKKRTTSHSFEPVLCGNLKAQKTIRFVFIFTIR
jgi:hypothetical protein